MLSVFILAIAKINRVVGYAIKKAGLFKVPPFICGSPALLKGLAADARVRGCDVLTEKELTSGLRGRLKNQPISSVLRW